MIQEAELTGWLVRCSDFDGLAATAPSTSKPREAMQPGRKIATLENDGMTGKNAHARTSTVQLKRFPTSQDAHPLTLTFS